MGAWVQLSQILGTSCMRAHSMRNNNHILHDDQTRCEANLYTSTTSADARSLSTDLLCLPSTEISQHCTTATYTEGGITGGLPSRSLITKCSWIPCGKVVQDLVSPLTPLPPNASGRWKIGSGCPPLHGIRKRGGVRQHPHGLPPI